MPFPSAIRSCFTWSVCRGSALRDRVLFFEAGFETLEVHSNAALRAFGGSPEIWDRPRNWLLQFTGCAQWPVRIAQKFAGNDDGVRLSGNENMLGLCGGCDHPDGAGQDVGFPADLLRKLRLITRTDRNLCLRQIAARRAIDQGCSKFRQLAGEFHRLLNIPPTIEPLGCRNTHDQWRSLRPCIATGGNRLAQDSSAILKRATVVIRPPIAIRR